MAKEITPSKNNNIEIKKEYFENGNLRSETPYYNGKKHGVYKEYFKTGEISCITEYIDDLLHGELKVYNQDGTLFNDTAIFINDKELEFDDIIEYENVSKNIIKRTVYLVKGVSAFEILHWKDGSKGEFCMLNNKPHGLAVIYYKTGELKRVFNYVNGIVEGKSTIYYKNGYVRLESNFLNGKLNGLRRKYRDNGEFIYEILYENDEMVASK